MFNITVVPSEEDAFKYLTAGEYDGLPVFAYLPRYLGSVCLSSSCPGDADLFCLVLSCLVLFCRRRSTFAPSARPIPVPSASVAPSPLITSRLGIGRQPRCTETTAVSHVHTCTSSAHHSTMRASGARNRTSTRLHSSATRDTPPHSHSLPPTAKFAAAQACLAEATRPR